MQHLTSFNLTRILLYGYFYWLHVQLPIFFLRKFTCRNFSYGNPANPLCHTQGAYWSDILGCARLWEGQNSCHDWCGQLVPSASRSRPAFLTIVNNTILASFVVPWLLSCSMWTLPSVRLRLFIWYKYVKFELQIIKKRKCLIQNQKWMKSFERHRRRQLELEI